MGERELLVIYQSKILGHVLLRPLDLLWLLLQRQELRFLLLLFSLFFFTLKYAGGHEEGVRHLCVCIASLLFDFLLDGPLLCLPRLHALLYDKWLLDDALNKSLRRLEVEGSAIHVQVAVDQICKLILAVLLKVGPFFEDDPLSDGANAEYVDSLLF